MLTGWLSLCASFVLGGALAAVYLWALWLTVRRLRRSRRPAVLVLGSFAVRTAALVAAFLYLVRDGHWERLLAALAGFVVVRSLVVVRARRARPAGVAAPEEGLS